MQPCQLPFCPQGPPSCPVTPSYAWLPVSSPAAACSQKTLMAVITPHPHPANPEHRTELLVLHLTILCEMHFTSHPRRENQGTGCLAWPGLPAEREFLVSLFGEDVSSTSGELARPSSPGEYTLGGGAPTIPHLLDTVFESICRPLKVRCWDSCLWTPDAAVAGD